MSLALFVCRERDGIALGGMDGREGGNGEGVVQKNGREREQEGRKREASMMSTGCMRTN